MAALEEALRRDPDNLRLLRWLARSLEKADRSEDAEPILRRVLVLAADDVEGHRDLVRLMWRGGKLDMAEAAAAAALEILPRSPELWVEFSEASQEASN